MLKGPKRSFVFVFVVLFLVVGAESWAKNFQMEQKMSNHKFLFASKNTKIDTDDVFMSSFQLHSASRM